VYVPEEGLSAQWEGTVKPASKCIT
jgi:hypothetical protein